ncbi:apoptosis facilitator Bcl-2-like protein 14 isoform X2 [Clupea harengus]|nr:apoptosis facilitator Bcl-2-like protein 14 isoform X2 [Clupea harengus]XP_031420995.1 apoptosis facilitator Bcl-2-like protein 14 isoform X2 [Clupea harengus]
MEVDSGEAIAAIPLLHSNEFKLLQAYCAWRRKGSRRRLTGQSPVALKTEPLTFQSRAVQNSTARIAVGSSLRVKNAHAQGSSGDDLGSVADKLTQIADNVGLVPDDLVTDSGDDVIQRLVELLKVAGDELDAELKKNPALVQQLQGSFSYGLFEKITRTFVDCAVPSRAGSTQSTQQAQIAMTCEVTSRLSALDLHPMNRIMGFGAQFLQQNFSGWVRQSGGWEKAFNGPYDEDDEVQ